MRSSYREIHKPTPPVKERYDRIKTILSSGSKTIRRIFYMLGGEVRYNTVIKNCVWLRLHNEIPWNSIIEEGRQLLGSRTYDNLADFIKSIPDEYRLSKRSAFKKHLEVWLEKATLESCFYQITDKYDVGLFVTRGQVSWTALKDASERLDENTLILYFGDNDSYGRKIYNGIQTFLNQLDCHPTFRRIALTDEQEKQFNFPHGEHHLDGVPEPELTALVESSIKQYLDLEAFNQLCEREHRDAAALEQFLESK